MPFAKPSEVSKNRIGRFMKLLQTESCQPQSAIFPDSSWQNLSALKQSLAELGNEDYEAIDDEILGWLDDYEYDSIQEALQTVKGDPIADDEDPPAPPSHEQPITNKTLLSAIADAQEQHPPKSKDSK